MSDEASSSPGAAVLDISDGTSQSPSDTRPRGVNSFLPRPSCIQPCLEGEASHTDSTPPAAIGGSSARASYFPASSRESPPYLSGLRLNQAYKSLQRGFEWVDIPPFAVIVGKNGVGKTALIEKIHDNSRINPTIRKIYNKQSPLILKYDGAFSQESDLRIEENFRIFSSRGRGTKDDYLPVQANYTTNLENLLKLLLMARSPLERAIQEINKILLEDNFKYRVRVDQENHFVELYNSRLDVAVPTASLSSGEKIYLFVVLWTFGVLSSGGGVVFLMDEPDAHLHPSFTKELIDMIKEKLINRLKIQVIITTHNPVTVSLVPKESLFVMKSDKQGIVRIQPIDQKRSAVQLLAENLVCINESFRTVFVEGPDDKTFYDAIYHRLTSAELLPTNVHLIFQMLREKEVTHDRQGSSCEIVKNLVKACVAELEAEDPDKTLVDFIFGLIDGDNKKQDDSKNLKALSRYSIENYIFDPIFVYFFLKNELEKQNRQRASRGQPQDACSDLLTGVEDILRQGRLLVPKQYSDLAELSEPDKREILKIIIHKVTETLKEKLLEILFNESEVGSESATINKNSENVNSLRVLRGQINHAFTEFGRGFSGEGLFEIQAGLGTFLAEIDRLTAQFQGGEDSETVETDEMPLGNKKKTKKKNDSDLQDLKSKMKIFVNSCPDLPGSSYEEKTRWLFKTLTERMMGVRFFDADTQDSIVLAYPEFMFKIRGHTIEYAFGKIDGRLNTRKLIDFLKCESGDAVPLIPAEFIEIFSYFQNPPHSESSSEMVPKSPLKEVGEGRSQLSRKSSVKNGLFGQRSAQTEDDIVLRDVFEQSKHEHEEGKVVLQSQREISEVMIDGQTIPSITVEILPDGDCGFTATEYALRIDDQHELAVANTRFGFINTVKKAILELRNAKESTSHTQKLRELLKNIYEHAGISFNLEQETFESWENYFNDSSKWAYDVHFAFMSYMHHIKFEFYVVDHANGRCFIPRGGDGANIIWGYPKEEEPPITVCLLNDALAEVDLAAAGDPNGHFDLLYFKAGEELKKCIRQLKYVITQDSPSQKERKQSSGYPRSSNEEAGPKISQGGPS